MPYFQGYIYADRMFTEWLYGDWSKEKLELYQTLNAIPGIHQYMDYKFDLRRDQEYMSRYGIDYSDIHDPRKLASTGSSARALEWVSHNISRLYK